MFIQLTVHQTLGGTEKRAIRIDRIIEVRPGTTAGRQSERPEQLRYDSEVVVTTPNGSIETWYCVENYDDLFGIIQPPTEEPNALTLSEQERETVVLARAIKDGDTREISNLLHNRQD